MLQPYKHHHSGQRHKHWGEGVRGLHQPYKCRYRQWRHKHWGEGVLWLHQSYKHHHPSVTSIGYNAFGGCTSLTSVVIGNGVTSIGDSAFEGCTSLISVVIGNGVTSIGELAFYYCTSLTSVTFEDPNGWWVSNSSTATSVTSISRTYLSNPFTAAKYLRLTYDRYYWKKG